MLKNKKSLFISYDGLLDQLGTSQILPYLEGLVSHLDELHVISFEKRNKMNQLGVKLSQQLIDKRIHWHPLIFSNKFGLIGKVFDAFKMQFCSLYLSWKYSIDIIHSRSHLPAIIGRLIKLLLQKKLLFDFRGLWVDERVDKGSWNRKFLFHNIQYKIFKYIERFLISGSDHIVVLTNKVIEEVKCLGQVNSEKITVIRCCSDYSHFKNLEHKSDLKSALNITKNAKIIGYLGSVGQIYMIREAINFFKECINNDPNTFLVVVTYEIEDFLLIAKEELNEAQLKNIRIQSASRNEVPEYINLMDLMVMFYTPTYARIATCPTRMGESFACGVPIISNEGIGDVSEIVADIKGGIIIHDTSSTNITIGMKKFFEGNFNSGNDLRNTSKEFFSLEAGVQKYLKVYESIFFLES